MNILRIYHTVRYLKPRQIMAQINQRIRARLENPSRFLSRMPPQFPGCIWQPKTSFLPPGIQVNNKEQILDGEMTFLNQTFHIGWMPVWNSAELSKLWLYNLHYFEWLWAFNNKDFDLVKAVCLDWIQHHCLARSQVGWEPYPIALRLMNWCSYFYSEQRTQTLADNEFATELWRSIWYQSEWLSSHIEYHLQGNHLLENAAALAIIGSCFDGDDASSWRKIGLNLLRKQLEEQMLEDGMHFERSPMYHSRIVYVLMMIYNTGHEELQQTVTPFISKALDVLYKLEHPDGEIALLNDSSFGIYNNPEDLIKYGVGLGYNVTDNNGRVIRPWALPDAGYYGFCGGGGTYVVCDAGQLGPDYIPGHAHADIFSFELSLNGKRVIVDSGVYDYEWSEERRYCRSTRAHNTVEIDRQDQAEMWGAFRVARRGYPYDIEWKPRKNGFHLSAIHDGYRRLPGKPLHRRSFEYNDDDYIKITDIIHTNCVLKCSSYIHLHPYCLCEMDDNMDVIVSYPAGNFLVDFEGPGKLEIQESQYYPEFSKKDTNIVLVYTWMATPQVKIVKLNIRLNQ